MVHFTVMDHDLMWSNDFEGEAFLEISKVTGINNDNRAFDEFKQIELPLTHPEYYEEMGIKPPKGVILYGEPGTGQRIFFWPISISFSRVIFRQNSIS